MKTRIPITIGIAVVLTLSVFIGVSTSGQKSIKDASTNVVLVEIDQGSIDKLGRWPFPRSLFGWSIEKLSGNGAAAIVIDVLFTEDSTKEGRR